MVDLRKSSLAPTAVVSPRKVLNICLASITSLSVSQNSAAAFAPLVSTSTSSAVQKSCSHHTSAFVANTSAKCTSRLATRGNLLINNSKQRPTSLVPRSAVIQSYRVEDDQNVSTSDAFSFLPSRISSIQRLESPSDFKSSVLDEKDSLVVVRFSADACPSCRATTPLFRRWSRDKEHQSDDAPSSTNRDKLEIKIVEMPLNKATSTFIQDNLNVEQLPYCHLYHPKMGLVEEQLVMNKVDFNSFVECVDKWASGDVTADYDSCILCSKDELIEDCQEWC